MTEHPIELHKIIKNSGKYNYLGCRIPIKFQLKVDVWAQELEGYWDTQLFDFLTYGYYPLFIVKSLCSWICALNTV